MISKRIVISLIISVSFFLFIPYATAQNITVAPAKVQAAIFYQLLQFNKNIATANEISIFVLEDKDFTEAMKKAIGRKVGSATIASVVVGTSLPATPPDIIYVSNPAKLSTVDSYCKTHKLLSITGLPELVEKGIALGVGLVAGKPKVLLNLVSSKQYGINWNPAILKAAKTVK